MILTMVRVLILTAGSYCYIGPQGIVHGTTITVLNAGRCVTLLVPHA